MTGPDDRRGSLEIHRTVVRKVVAHAVRLVPGAEPSATVKVGEDGADLELALKLALRYPAPVRATAADVRRRVTEEVERITGYRVRSVAVTVSALRAETRPRVV
ncbi:cell envelope-related Asp23 family protein [Saccharothrix saharensis]|uniref:Cell envelope-related Asp23 family protein n=1 Tax=Saccharothrix saharensis TaxID=571190 RepID=A0A543JB83_9PSEU|nr:Asp23/Gls24 family envelope stress response protein [Saccharothrix saharensis]TQM80080.1 cell envelope-related Asp23 family protein [Saccharothrix saharensis]